MLGAGLLRSVESALNSLYLTSVLLERMFQKCFRLPLMVSFVNVSCTASPAYPTSWCQLPPQPHTPGLPCVLAPPPAVHSEPWLVLGQVLEGHSSCGHRSLCLGRCTGSWAVTAVSCKKLENTAPEFTCPGGVCWERLKASGRHLSGGAPTVSPTVVFWWALVSSALGLQDLGLLCK